MKFLLDENFPKTANTLLEDLGHEAIDFRVVGKTGSPDSDVMRLALEKSAEILSTDRDFFHTLGRQHSEHHGIVVIALKRPTRKAILDRLTWFLEHFNGIDLSRRSFQLRDVAWMVYPPFENSES